MLSKEYSSSPEPRRVFLKKSAVLGGAAVTGTPLTAAASACPPDGGLTAMDVVANISEFTLGDIEKKLHTIGGIDDETRATMEIALRWIWELLPDFREYVFEILESVNVIPPNKSKMPVQDMEWRQIQNQLKPHWQPQMSAAEQERLRQKFLGKIVTVMLEHAAAKE